MSQMRKSWVAILLLSLLVALPVQGEQLLQAGDTSLASRPIEQPARQPWYSRAWDATVKEVRMLPGTIRAFPRAYWETARSGQQISSLAGFVDRGTATMNPVGVGTNYGPLLGQREAYQQGGTVGTVTGNVENTVLLATGVHGLARATPGLVRSVPGAARNAWGWARGARSVAAPVTAEAAQAAEQTRRIYSARVLARNADDAFHDFPMTFDDVIFQNGQRTVQQGWWRTPRPNMGNDSINYTLRGYANGKPGTYEIFTRPSASGRTEVINHRLFRPDR